MIFRKHLQSGCRAAVSALVSSGGPRLQPSRGGCLFQVFGHKENFNFD